MPEIRSEVSTRSRYFHISFYDIKVVSKYPSSVTFLSYGLKKAIAIKWLNESGTLNITMLILVVFILRHLQTILTQSLEIVD